MKNKILLFLFSFIAFTASAQVRLGFTCGPNFSNQKWVSNNQKMQVGIKERLQYHLGAIADFAIAEKLSLQPELLFSYNGAELTADFPLAQQYTKTNLGYLKMPVCLVGLIDANKAFIYYGAGPYISTLAINNFTFTQNGEQLNSGKLRVGKTTDDQITPWDFGARIKAGFQMKKGFMMGVFYDLGLKDINPQMVQTYNRTFGVSLAYLFSVSEEDRYHRYPDYYNF